MMLKILQNKYFRDFCHILFGVILGVLLDYSFEGVNLFGRLLLTAITVTVIATIYEVTIHFINEDNKVNWWDVIITVIPALITVLILWI